MTLGFEQRRRSGLGLEGGGTTPLPTRVDVLANQAGGNPASGSSVLGKIFNVVNAPVRGVATAVDRLLESEEAGSPYDWSNVFDPTHWDDFVGGLVTGVRTADPEQDVTSSFSDVIEQAGVTGDDFWSKVARGGGGLALDILLDPLTYVGVGAAAKGTSKAGRILSRNAENIAAPSIRAGQAAARGKAAAETAESLAGKRVGRVDDLIKTEVDEQVNSALTEIIGGRSTVRRSNAHTLTPDQVKNLNKAVELSNTNVDEAFELVENIKSGLSKQMEKRLRKEDFSLRDLYEHGYDFKRKATRKPKGPWNRYSATRSAVLKRDFDEAIDAFKRNNPDTPLTGEGVRGMYDEVLSDFGDITTEALKERVKGSATEFFKNVNPLPEREIELRFMGKRVGGSTRLYDDLMRIKENIYNRPFMKRWSTKAELPEGLSAIRSETLGQITSATEAIAEKFNRVLRETGVNNSTSLERITHAIESGSLVSLNAQELAVAEAVQDIFQEMGQREVAMGLLSEADLLDNYVPHYFRESSEKSANVNRWKNQRKTKRYSTAHLGSAIERDDALKTLAVAKGSPGLTPVLRIDEIMGKRLAEHSMAMGQADFIQKVSDQFGAFMVDIGSKENINSIKRMGFKGIDEVDDIMKQVDFRRVDFEVGKRKFAGYFEDRFADILQEQQNTFKDLAKLEGMVERYDKWLANWKVLATVVNPGHHVRNLLGDIHLAFTGGFNDAKAFSSSAFHNSIKPFESRIGQGIAEGIRKTLKAAGVRVDDQGRALYKLGDRYVSWDKIDDLYTENGLSGSFFRAEFTHAPGSAIGGKRIGKRGLEKIRQLSTARETVVRQGVFAESLKKRLRAYQKANPNVKITDDLIKSQSKYAAADVRKYLIDYTDLTHFERNVMKRINPFYTFMRKNLPLQLEAMVMHPARFGALDKANNALEELTGGASVPDRIRQQIPNWMRDFPLIGSDQGSPTSLAFSTPTHEAFDRVDAILNPTGASDTSGIISNTFRQAISDISPYARVPTELAFNREAYSNREISADLRYLMNQIPPSRGAELLFGVNPSSNPIGLQGLNYITGAGIQQGTPVRREAELRRQEDVLRAVIGRQEGA